ncbi:hypothetical protein AvCA_34520 [Azotobacter vinelandii CA]|uniref:Uncharacterized protein n=2 Tax=Azotobacter vinelandii TaxID=354 RepID=C1DQG5_AZOVD|nr:hypothetical protein Avin_34520 [Azotobacter vinelandii DJ]AGK14639.1 hypothetical protein AvCA_34520 [Azotobacter vinelandii CA]AGK21348.1 hypothetical protein AvCA6_34520 [Azotobacter vinelandii CA6]
MDSHGGRRSFRMPDVERASPAARAPAKTRGILGAVEVLE